MALLLFVIARSEATAQAGDHNLTYDAKACP